MRIHIHLLAAIALVPIGCITYHPAKTSLADVSISQPDFFPIVPWDSYHAPKTNGTAYAGLDTLADCNFTVGGFAAPKDLAQFERLGLGAFVNCNPAGKPWSQLT